MQQSPARRPKRSPLLPLLGGVAGVVVLALLVRALGPARIVEHLRLVGPGFAWLLAAYFVAIVLYSLPLGVVLPPGIRPRPHRLVAGRLAAAAVNAATPLLGLGGEPVRLLWLNPLARSHGTAGLFLDRGAFLVASALFLVAGAIVATTDVPLPRAVCVVVLVVATLALLLSATLLILQRRGGIAGPLARVAGFVFRRHRDRLQQAAAGVDARIRALHVEEPGRFTAAIALHLLGRCAAALEVYAGARLLGMSLGAPGTLVLAAGPLAVDFAFSMVPSQVGLHEGANALLAQALGFDPAAGVALAFLQRVRQVLFVGAGFALLAFRRSDPAPNPAT